MAMESAPGYRAGGARVGHFAAYSIIFAIFGCCCSQLLRAYAADSALAQEDGAPKSFTLFPPPPKSCGALLFPSKIDFLGSSLIRSASYSRKHAEALAREIPEVGAPSNHPAFELLSSELVKELDAWAALYVHRTSGLRVLSFSTSPRTDKEMTFMAGFRTPVKNSKGIPHILEHSVLNGSVKYPVKDPFQSMNNSSLYTYLNASTYKDRTIYPVASVNEKDLYNLASVYMDAVFNPLVVHNPHSFQQEGWRYSLNCGQDEKDHEGRADGAQQTDEEMLQRNETLRAQQQRDNGVEEREITKHGIIDGANDETADIKDCKLSVMGVVYSEMKGVFSSAAERHYERSNQLLFKDMPEYSMCSGGSPADIPTLTFNELKEFYYKFYTPKNGILFFWGPDSVSKRLKFVEDYMSNFMETVNKQRPQSHAADSAIGSQPVFKEPMRSSIRVPGSHARLEDIISVQWVLNPREEGTEIVAEITSYDVLVLNVLSILLVKTPASPIYKALMDLNIGKNVSGGVDTTLKHAVFSAQLDGVSPGADTREQVEETILQTLDLCMENGFEELAVEAAVHTIEFKLREFGSSGTPKGQSVFLEVMINVTYDRDPFYGLGYEDDLSKLRKALASGEDILREYLQKYLIKNKHRLTLKSIADSSVESEEEAEEQEQMAAKLKEFDESKIQEMLEMQKVFKQTQETPDSPEARASLPQLALGDIEDVDNEIPERQLSVSGVPVLAHTIPSHGILYTTMLISLADVPLEAVPMLDILCQMLTESGTTTLSSDAVTHLLGRTTGGISAFYSVSPKTSKTIYVADKYDTEAFLIIKAKVLAGSEAELFCILQTLLSGVNLGNSNRFLHLLKEAIGEIEASFINTSHRVAFQRSTGLAHAEGFISELKNGLPAFQNYKRLLESASSDFGPVVKKFSDLLKLILRRENLMLSFAGDEETLRSLFGFGNSANAEGKRDLGSHAKLESQRGSGPAFEALENFVEAFPVSTTLPVSENTFRREQLWVSQLREQKALGVEVAEGWMLPIQVNFVAASWALHPAGYERDGSEFVACEWLMNHPLYDAVRKRNGAYGVYCKYRGYGVYSFVSYRDPNVDKTLEVYTGVSEHMRVATASISREELTKAIVVGLRGIDNPVAVANMPGLALLRHLQRETKQNRRRWREQVLTTTPEKLAQFAALLADSGLSRITTGGDGKAVAGHSAAGAGGAVDDGEEAGAAGAAGDSMAVDAGSVRVGAESELPSEEGAKVWSKSVVVLGFEASLKASNFGKHANLINPFSAKLNDIEKTNRGDAETRLAAN